jgi:tRNA 2-(methylsulfanyl)-N6-isopentenyladenosine37 hydroxylase
VTGEIRLRRATPESWAVRSATRLPELVADHAVCELQASVHALSLVGAYPANAELVDRLSALAAEELRHFRRVAKEARRLGAALPSKRRNHYVAALRAACRGGGEPAKGLDLLLVAALIETRSEERFRVLRPHVSDARLGRIYDELADDEARHGPIDLSLARSHAGAAAANARLEELLDVEDSALSGTSSREIAVHSGTE